MKRLAIVLVVSIVTPFLAFIIFEITARIFWPNDEGGDKCIQPDSQLIYSHVPHCHYSAQIVESERVEYSYDGCGFRNVIPCTSESSRSTRIAFIGDSFTEGMAVGVEDGYVWRSRQELFDRGISVDVLNLGVNGYDLIQYHETMNKALAFEPQLIVLGLLPNDLFETSGLNDLQRFRDRLASLGPTALMREREWSWHDGNLLNRARYLLSKSTAATLVQHFVFSNDWLYLQTYLARGTAADYLQREYSLKWEQKVAGAAYLLEHMHRKATSAGADFVVLFIPQRIQAAMMTATNLDDHIDPSALSHHLRHSLRHNIHFLDFSDSLRVYRHPSTLYFPVDGHLNKEGHRLLARTLADDLLTYGLLGVH